MMAHGADSIDVSAEMWKVGRVINVQPIRQETPLCLTVAVKQQVVPLSEVC